MHPPQNNNLISKVSLNFFKRFRCRQNAMFIQISLMPHIYFRWNQNTLFCENNAIDNIIP